MALSQMQIESNLGGVATMALNMLALIFFLEPGPSFGVFPLCLGISLFDSGSKLPILLREGLLLGLFD